MMQPPVFPPNRVVGFVELRWLRATLAKIGCGRVTPDAPPQYRPSPPQEPPAKRWPAQDPMPPASTVVEIVAPTTRKIVLE